MTLNKRLVSCVAMLIVMGVAINARGQPVGDDVVSRVQDLVTSYVSTTAGEIRYSDPIPVRDAQWVFFPYTLSGCGASTPVGVAIQWLEEDFTRANAQWSAATDGYQLTSGWASNVDAATSHTRVSSGDFITSSPVKAPFCRLAFNPEHADDGDGHITAYYYKRYTPLADQITHIFVSEDVTAGDDIIAWDDGYAYDDIIATDDLFVGDDAIVGDDLDVGGLLTVDESIACSASATLGTGSTPIVKIVWTSGTITAGASSASITLPTGYAVANWRLRHDIVPAIAGNSYAGYGDSYLAWEGGTTAEVRISSATFINLIAEVQATRVW